MKNINTFMDYSRNGITVYSKVVTENNSYRMIARIAEYGKIILYVPEDYISSDDMEKSIRQRERVKQSFYKH